MNREHWLQGWTRDRDQVLVGNQTFCAGCGKYRGSFTIAEDPATYKPHTTLRPEWPFNEDGCPVCYLRDKREEDARERRIGGPHGRLP